MATQPPTPSASTSGLARDAEEVQINAAIAAQPTLLVPWTKNILCAFCRNIVSSPSASIQISEKLLKISAARGCGLCRFFYEELVARTFRASHQRLEQMEMTRNGGDVTVLDCDEKRHRFEIYAVDSPGIEPSAREDLHAEIQPELDSEHCWARIQSWLSKCESHAACSQVQNAGLPTRLIDVHTMRLVDASSCPADSYYATLSHSWGVQPFLRLTAKTLDYFRSGIDLQCLPKTLEDAMYVTRRLNLSYLWIDALCIIQGSTEDWNIEARKMGLYYRHAYVNLSALSSTGVYSGLLNPRQQKSSMSLENGLRLRRARPTWHEALSKAPLSTRGWVMQERLLSNRIVHFEKDELFWECSTTSAREGSYMEDSLPWLPRLGGDEHFKRCLVFQGVGPTVGVDPNREIMKRWDRIVCHYSTLNFTYGADVLPAIDGIAQRISEATGFAYRVGLWQEDLHAGLLWHADTFITDTVPNIRAPSWSWMSLGRPVNMIYGMDFDMSHSSYEADFVAAISLPRWDTEVLGRLELKAYHFDVWCRSSSDGCAPYSDPYLRMVVDIFDKGGMFIGTGYWDRLPDTPSAQATAIVVCQRHDASLGTSPITNFLLAEDKGDHFVRIGIGHTVDALHGRGTTSLDLEKCERKDFLLL